MVHFLLQLQVQNPLSNVPFVDCDSLAHLYSQNNRTYCFVDQIGVAPYWQIYLTTRIEGLRAKRVYMFWSICASFSLFARRPSIMSDINCTFFWNVRLLFQTSCSVESNWERNYLSLSAKAAYLENLSVKLAHLENLFKDSANLQSATVVTTWHRSKFELKFWI